MSTVYPNGIYLCGNSNSMKVLSLKLDDDVFTDTESIVKKMGMPRNRYINEALAIYNRYNHRKLVRAEFKREAPLAKESSIAILREFEALDDDQAI